MLYIMQTDVRRGAAGIVKMARHIGLGVSVALKFHQHREMRDHSAEIIKDCSSTYVAALVRGPPGRALT